MKSFLLFSVLLLVGYLIGQFTLPHKSHNMWMDLNFTTAVKGFSILTVIWAHTGAMLGVGGIQFIAGIGVALFLICSGYGLELSYQKNGLKDFWRKRLLKVCLPFWCVELVGLLATERFTAKHYILDVLFVEPATIYGWFMQYIVICYILFYECKALSEKKRYSQNSQHNILFAIFLVWFVAESLWFADPAMPFLKARQMLCFPCGVMMAKHRDKLRNIPIGNGTVILTGGGHFGRGFFVGNYST